MENQITTSVKRVAKMLSIFLGVLISMSSLAQHPGHGGPGHGGPGHGGPGNGGPGHGGPGHGSGHGHGPGNHPVPCNAHFFTQRDSVVNGIVFIHQPGSGAATFAWDFGDGSTSNLANPQHTYATQGTYYVCLTVTDTIDGGCSNTYCDSVRVFTPPPHCNAHFRSRLDSIPNGIRFRSVGNSPGTTYAWDFGDGSTSSAANPAHAYAAAGYYYVCLTVTNTNSSGTCTETFCDSVHAWTPPPHCNAHFRARRDTDTTIVNGVMFNSFSNAPNTTYAWDFGDGSTSSVNDPAYAYAAPGTYYVCLTVTRTTAGGTCTETHCDSVNTNFPHHPGPGHHHHHHKLASGNDLNSGSVIAIYPNPVVDKATISVANTSGNAVLRLYTVTGQLALTKNIANGDNIFNKENLNEGMYFYSIEDGNNVISKGKLRIY
jgi:PKD repeat protein